MQKKLTITVPDEFAADLDELAHEKECSIEEIALGALKGRIAALRLEKLSAKMIPHAQKMGIHTDQDVFDRVS